MTRKGKRERENEGMMTFMPCEDHEHIKHLVLYFHFLMSKKRSEIFLKIVNTLYTLI